MVSLSLQLEAQSMQRNISCFYLTQATITSSKRYAETYNPMSKSNTCNKLDEGFVLSEDERVAESVEYLPDDPIVLEVKQIRKDKCALLSIGK